MKTLLFAAVTATTVLAQSAVPTFEVASIKQNKSGESRAVFGGPASRFTVTNTPALALITYAFRTQEFLLEGVPAWAKNDRWDISARAEGDFPATTTDEADPRHEMVRALLVGRFRLSIHKETRERPIYAMFCDGSSEVRSGEITRSPFRDVISNESSPGVDLS